MKRFLGLTFVLMVLAACAQWAPEGQLEPSQAEASAPFVIDFNNLKTGQIVWNVTPRRGMTRTATDIGKVKVVARRDNNKGRRLNGNRAMVFDAACKGSSTRCTGNTSGFYHPEQGKVAIISENNNSVNPKPNKWGGIIDFKFDQFAQGRADLKSIKVFGVERKGGHIDLYRDRQRVARIPIPVTGVSGSATVALNTANVGLMRVRLVGAGAVDDVMLGSHNDDGGDGGTTLPPDPGEAGKATLAGIDSDNDGVRDDVERYIELTYPNDRATINMLTEYAKLSQESILKTHNEAAIVQIEQQVFQLTFCLAQWQPDSFDEYKRDFLSVFFNTPERFRAEMRHLESIPTSSYEIDNSLIQNCSQEVRSKLTSSRNSLSASRFAEDADVIFFLNGVWNTIEDARDSQLALHNKTGIRVIALHNRTDSTIGDLIEVLAQKYNESEPNWRKWFFRKDDSNLVLVDLIDDASGLIANVITRSARTEDLNTFRAKYEQFKNRNAKIVIVSHSQGNLFANELYDMIAADPRTPKRDGNICGLDVVAVGTPAKRTVGSGFYRTNHLDLIINNPAVSGKSSNIRNSIGYKLGLAGEDLAGHTFLKTYLKGDVIGPEVEEGINDAFNKMLAPNDCVLEVELTATPISGEAPFKVTATATAEVTGGGEVVDYTFDFGDGEEVSGKRSSVSHVYNDPGSYEIAVTVTDDTGRTASDSVTVNVSNTEVRTYRETFTYFYTESVDDLIPWTGNTCEGNFVTTTESRYGRRTIQAFVTHVYEGTFDEYGEFRFSKYISSTGSFTESNSGWGESPDRVSRSTYNANGTYNRDVNDFTGSYTQSIGVTYCTDEYSDAFSGQATFNIPGSIYNPGGEEITVIGDDYNGSQSLTTDCSGGTRVSCSTTERIEYTLVPQ